MRKLEDVFDGWAEDDGGGEPELEVRDLKECFRELGREVDGIELQTWCDEADLTANDALSLADFAYAFHAIFVDTGAEGACVYVCVVDFEYRHAINTWLDRDSLRDCDR